MTTFLTFKFFWKQKVIWFGVCKVISRVHKKNLRIGVGNHTRSTGKEISSMNKFKKFIEKHGEKICDMTVKIASTSLASNARGYWYESKQPDGLKEFMDSHAKKDA